MPFKKSHCGVEKASAWSCPTGINVNFIFEFLLHFIATAIHLGFTVESKCLWGLCNSNCTDIHKYDIEKLFLNSEKNCKAEKCRVLTLLFK